MASNESKPRATTSQKREAVPKRARIQGPQTFASLNAWLESNNKEEEVRAHDHCGGDQPLREPALDRFFLHTSTLGDI